LDGNEISKVRLKNFFSFVRRLRRSHNKRLLGEAEQSPHWRRKGYGLLYNSYIPLDKVFKEKSFFWKKRKNTHMKYEKREGVANFFQHPRYWLFISFAPGYIIISLKPFKFGNLHTPVIYTKSLYISYYIQYNIIPRFPR